jgi:hypothetical protein
MVKKFDFLSKWLEVQSLTSDPQISYIYHSKSVAKKQ